jgi:hypothetical protein
MAVQPWAGAVRVPRAVWRERGGLPIGLCQEMIPAFPWQWPNKRVQLNVQSITPDPRLQNPGKCKYDNEHSPGKIQPADLYPAFFWCPASHKVQGTIDHKEIRYRNKEQGQESGQNLVHRKQFPTAGISPATRKNPAHSARSIQMRSAHA